MTEQTAALQDRAGLERALQVVRQRIDAACLRAQRDPAGVAILPVSKSVSAQRLVTALEAGLTTFAENRVQEAETKAADLPRARWQLVGHLQSNKAARAVTLFEAIHSVDSVELARRLDRLARDIGRAPYSIYLEVNVDRDPSKAGFDPDQVEAMLAELVTLDALELRGLMTVGRDVGSAEEARPTFRRLRDLSAWLRTHHPILGSGLSMGMSDDFEVAVEEGATVIRLGRVLFGERRTT